jgi:hypothetical protein
MNSIVFDQSRKYTFRALRAQCCKAGWISPADIKPKPIALP